MIGDFPFPIQNDFLYASTFLPHCRGGFKTRPYREANLRENDLMPGFIFLLYRP